MNNARRKRLQQICDKFVEIVDGLREVLEEETTAFDNLPENLQESDRGNEMQIVIDSLDNAVSMCDEINDLVQEAIST